MPPSVGSPADVSCPKCPSQRGKVALTTGRAIFYRCEKCQHVWRIPVQAGAKATATHKAS
jgi:DNA-directed RNA polymerase subunit M/transcription elongation factor TFIIS